LPCPRIFENSQKNLRRARIKKIFRKCQAQQEKNLYFSACHPPGAQFQILVPLNFHAPRTLDTFQSNTMNSHTRLRSLSFGARVGERARSSRLDARDWRNIANAAPSNPDDSVGSQGGPAALDEGVGFGTSNEPQSGTANAVPASPAAYSDTQVDSEQSDAENGAWAEAEDNQAAAGAAAAAAPVLERGGKAQHCTLGTVSIIEMGALGARIEFFSMRDNTVRERQVLLAHLEPLPDEAPFEAPLDEATPDDVDNDDPLQARSPARRTRAAEPCAVTPPCPVPCPKAALCSTPVHLSRSSGNHDRLRALAVRSLCHRTLPT